MTALAAVPDLGDDPFDLMLGQIVETFYEDNDEQAWALCLDIQHLDMQRTDDPWENLHVAQLNVVPQSLQRFDGVVYERIRQRTMEITNRNGWAVTDVSVHRVLPTLSNDWRAKQREREAAMAEGITNQARRPNKPGLPSEDGFVFRSTAEVAVYRVLKKMQANARDGFGFTILALPLARLQAGNVVEPDFVIAINQRIGVIEVDGPHHKGRRVADTTRERLFRPSGIWMFERIMPEDTEDEDALYGLLATWLKKVAAQ